MAGVMLPALSSVLQPVMRSVLDPPLRRGSSWSPAELFANGEQGALYYLTEDFAGLYQDAAGTTPVTEVGQPVGLMLDRRFGLVRGAELTAGFNDPGAWDTSTGATIADGEATFIDVSSGSGIFTAQTHTIEQGRWYEAAITLSEVTQGAASWTIPFVISGTQRSSPGAYRQIFMAPATRTTGIGARAFGTTSAKITHLSIREIPGNHAIQPTTTARPTLRSGPLRIDYDGADDFLRTTFPYALGSNVTIARSIPGVGAQILTGQTVGTEWDDDVTSCATLVIDRALTDSETALVTAFLNQQAGV